MREFWIGRYNPGPHRQKTPRTCTNCRKNILELAIECPYCGKKVRENAHLRETASTPKTKQEVVATQFCSSCGNQLLGQAPAVQAAANDNKPNFQLFFAGISFMATIAMLILFWAVWASTS